VRCPAWVLLKLKSVILDKHKIEDEYETEKRALRQERKEIEEYKIKIQKMYIEVTRDNDRKVLNYVNELQEWKDKETVSLKREMLQRKLDLEHKDFELSRYKEQGDKQEQLQEEVNQLKQQLAIASADLQARKEEADSLIAEVVRKDNDIVELENKIISKDYTIEELTQKQNLSSKELKMIKKMGEEKDKIVQALQDEISRLRNDIISLRQTAASRSEINVQSSNVSNTAGTNNSPKVMRIPLASSVPSPRGPSVASPRDRSVTSPALVLPPQVVTTPPPKSKADSVDAEELSAMVANLSKKEPWKIPVKQVSCKLDWLDSGMKSNTILQMLLREDMSLVSAFRDVLEGDDQTIVANALVHLSESANKQILRNLIRHDVDKCTQVSFLFRSHSLVAKVLSAYSAVVGAEYLKSTLYPVIQDIVASRQSYEIDPSIVTDEKVRSLNIVSLMSTIKRVLQWLLDSAKNLPPSFCEIASMIWTETTKKFNEEERLRALSIWIFGRFFAPAIYSPPESYGFSDICIDSKKLLLTISRVVQHAAHGNAFKERHMTLVNSVIAEFWPNMKNFLLVLKKNTTPAKATAQSRMVLQMTSSDAIKKIARVMVSNKQPIVEHVKNSKPPPLTNTYHFKTFDRLSFVCGQIGLPTKGKKIAIGQHDPKAEEFAKLFLEEPRVIEELAPLSFKLLEGDKFAQSVVILCHSHNSLDLVPEYVKSFLATDLVADAKKEAKLNDGMASKMFSPYANLIATEYMTESLDMLVNDHKSIAEESKQSVVQEWVSRFIRHILATIHKIPFPVWDMCHYIYTVVGPKRGVRLVTSFLFARFYCPGILNPEAYCQFEDDPSKKVRKFFTTVGDMISRIASPELGVDESYTQYSVNEREVMYKVVDGWMTRPASVPPPPQPPDTPFPWNIQEEAIRYLHRILYDNLVPLSHKLGDTGVTNTLTHKLPEILEIIVSPQLLDDL
jgi:hypothetical protein